MSNITSIPKKQRTEEEIYIEHRWQDLLYELKGRFGRKPDLQSMLFLIGVQELNQMGKAFSKEEKQDLMHIAVCKLLSTKGIYKLQFTDEDGWPHYIPLKEHPDLNLVEQEFFLKQLILDYFDMI